MSKQQLAKTEIAEIEYQFYSKSHAAIHGGKKGNGFWIYNPSGVCVQNDGKKSGNPRFWMMDDAKVLLASL
jgi:hypothetical protein